MYARLSEWPLTLGLSEGGLHDLVFSVAVPSGLQLHAQLFILHQGTLFLHPLLFQLCLKAVNLGLELCDVALGL